jgi:hypothetical protein
MRFVDHGPGGSGEPAATLPRPGSAGSYTASGHGGQGTFRVLISP